MKQTWIDHPLDPHDQNDPSPWHALLLDRSIPIDPEAKRIWLKDTSSTSRQFLLPVIRPFARLSLIVVQVLKLFIPNRFRAVSLLHWCLVFGMKHFVSPEANWLVMRHFHLGAEIQQFILKNLPGVNIPELNFMRFRNLDELMPDGFVKHDLNLFNFVIWLNQELQAQGRTVKPPEKLDFSMIKEGPLLIDPMPSSLLNKVDLLTAIEIFTPVFQLFLTDSDFWRAANSLQLDETIAIYSSQILNDPLPLMLVNNRHPMVAMSTLRAGFRLVLHGLSTEMLHAHLVQFKRAHTAAQA